MTREGAWPFVRSLLGLGLAALLVFGALLAWARATRPEPGVDGASLMDVPLAGDKSLGISADLSGHDAAAREEALAGMQTAGFRWLRQHFPWDAIESSPGVYDWTVWDEIVEGAGRHNLELVAVLDGSPEWVRAAEDAENPAAPPIEVREYGAFVAAFAERFGDQVDHYQIWDEPNIAPHWGQREVDPAGYARLLREGAIQIRTADPGAVILAAALAPNVEPGGANMSDLVFLDELYQERAAEWFDVVATQSYAFGKPADTPADPGQLNWRRAALLREVMETHGDEETAVWATSVGLGPGDTGTAQAVTEAVEGTRLDWPWLGPMLWAAWSPDDLHGQYALTDEDGRQAPLFRTLRTLASAPSLAWPGVYPADHPSGQYEGGWRVTPLGADIGQSGDVLTIPFRGTRLDLTVRRGDYRAFLFVSVDGEPANALPQDSQGRAYVVLYDPLRAIDRVTLVRGLSDSEHVAEIVAERGWSQWAIVGWTVSRAATRNMPWLWLAPALGLAALVVLGVVLYESWPRRHSLLTAGGALIASYRGLDDRLVLTVTAGAGILVYITVGTIPSLVAAGLLAVLLLLRPEMGLPVIAVALPFYQVGKPLLGRVFSMVEILTLLTAVGWVVNRVFRNPAFGAPARNRESRVTTVQSRLTNQAARVTSHVSRLTVLDWGVIALVAVGAASLLWAEHGRVATREYRTVILGAALFYGLLRAMVRDWRGVWRVADAWVLGGALIGLMGVFQWVVGQNLISAEGVWRVRGFYGSPNNLALYLGRVLPLGIALAAWGKKGWRRWAYGLAAVAMGFAILLSYSRGAWLLGVPASLLFLAAVRGRRFWAVAVVLLFVVAVVVMLVAGTGRMTSLLDTAEGTTFLRLQLWRSSWAMITDHPLLGVGLDNFLYQYRTHYVLPTAWEEFDLSHPHNLVLDFWLRVGLPGLMILGWLLVAYFRRGWRAFRQSAEGNEQLLVLGLMGGMINVVAHGLVDNAFFLVDLAFAFMLMLAMIQMPRASDQYPTSSSLRRG